MPARLLRSAFFLGFAIALMLVLAPTSFAEVHVSITVGPPPLPIYEQPLCPGDGFIWVPGYWAYDYDILDYFWVPGTWVFAPEVGFFWTPGYWAWVNDGFFFYDGYWGPVVGFYGGINYGYGYFGTGFVGGRWDNGHFFYNRSFSNVSVHIRNVYNETIVNNTTVSHVSYNGGRGGVVMRPTPEQEAAARERHIPAVSAQTKLVQTARADKQQRASVNAGRPAVAATPRPGKLNEKGFVPAKEAGAPYNPPENRTEAGNRGNAPRPGSPVHPRDLSEIQHPPAPNTGDAARDRQYQQEQENLMAQQQKERQELQQQQEMEHQRLQQEQEQARQQQMQQQQERQQEMQQERQQQMLQERQQQMQQREQQMEMMHQQQTMEMEQRQSRQWQDMGERQGWRRR